jgi:hypothetical protein
LKVQDWHMKTITDGSYKTDTKKELTQEEFVKAKTACEFVIDLTKAISRSGYYDSSHPVSLDVKKGLYGSFINALGNSSEIMLTCHELGETVDIHISGILDEPFNIRKLTKENTLDLFVPKLKDYFERKSLNSFVIKKNITPEHFESFIDVMSEPVAENADSSSLGEYLTKALVNLNITEVTTIFKTDIVLHAKLPWRVSIILRRLAKDLKVLPMFRNASMDKIKQIRKEIVADIIRPLNNNELLRDLLINCDVIASHLAESMETDELEAIIVDSLPANELVPVTRIIFEVYKQTKTEMRSDKDNPKYREKCDYLAKVLDIAAKHIVVDHLPDTADLFKELYDHQIIKFEMLPEEIRFNMQSVKLAGDVISKIDSYIEKASKTSSLEEMESLVVVFRRIMPELIRIGEWDAIVRIVKVISGFLSREGFESGVVNKFLNLPDSVFEGCDEIFAHKYINAEPEERKKINEIMMQMTSMCVRIADVIFDKCKDPNILRSVIELLSKKGDLARRWCIKILNDQNQPVSMLNVALLVIINVGQTDDIGLIKRYIKHSNSSIRNKALGVIAKLNKQDAEISAIEALGDEDEKVRIHAANIIERELSLSDESVKKLILLIKAKLEKKKDMTIHEAGFIAGLLKAIGKSADYRDKEHLEDDIIVIASDLLKGKNVFQKFIKTEPGKEQLEIISACLSSLGRIGGSKSRDYLKKLSHGDTTLSKIAHEAVELLNRKLA